MLFNTKTFKILLITFLGCLLLRPVTNLKAEDLPADVEEAASPIEHQLENLSWLLDQAKYKKVEEEWKRIAPLAQHIKLERKFAEQLTAFYARTTKKILETGEYSQALERWEHAVASHLQVEEELGRRHWYLIWELSRAYVKINKHEKAIQLFKQFYYERPMPRGYEAPETIERRAKFGELLIFGEIVPTIGQGGRFIGRGLCTLCHAFTKVNWKQGCYHTRCGPDLQDVISRTKQLLTSPEYVEGRKTSIQPEAFTDSGVPTTVMEYLAESNVCSSCYVVPGYLNWPDENGRESRMPSFHKPPNSLTVEEMIAITTWMYVYSGLTVPPLSEMQAAYDKFLPTEDRPDTPKGLFLASLYDAKGDFSETLRLVEKHYPRVWKRQSEKTLLGHYLREWQKDQDMFAHLKKFPDLVKKFPLLLQPQ